MFLIAAHARSGTTYTFRFLRALGLDVGHEVIEPAGSVSWMHIAEASRFDTIFHQVRHPLATVSSSQTLAPVSWEFIGRHIELPGDAHLIVRCAHSWVKWNRLIGQSASWRYRIEDMDDIFPEFCAHLGIPEPKNQPDLPKDLNHRGHSEVSLSLSIGGPGPRNCL